MASATVGSFFFVALSAIGTGLTASCVRWLTIDTLHHKTGLHPPAWSFSLLAERAEAFHLLIDIHYKYYQFYGNCVVAIIFSYSVWRTSQPLSVQPVGWADAVSLALTLIFLAGSRDALKRYYQRAGELLQTEKPKPRKRVRRKK